MEDSNRCPNPSIHDISSPARRTVLRGGLGAAVTGLLAPLAGCGSMPGTPTAAGPLLGFAGIAASRADRVMVPTGYIAEVLAPWGEPVGVPGNMPAFRDDAGNTAAEQAVQMGMHHDGMHIYPLPGADGRALLVMNHEYTDEGLLHPDGQRTWSAEKVRKSQAAMGVSVIEIARRADGGWDMVRPSRLARRITASTPMRVAGPAAGHALLRTAADPAGERVLGTINNCASGRTP